jgi:hypothetical protein
MMPTAKKAVRHSRQFRYLLEDAQRDWSALGQEKLQIVPLTRTKQGQPIKLRQGILFTTYGSFEFRVGSGEIVD